MSYAAESHMFHAAVLCAFHTPGNTIAGAIRIITKKGTATNNAFGREGLVGVIAFDWSRWICRATGHAIVVAVIIICTPFPYIACHIIEAIAIGGKRGYGSSMIIMIGFGVLIREVAVPKIASCLTSIDSFITPGIDIVF